MNYVFQFQGKAFSPDGRVEMTPDEIEAHNSQVQAMELEVMKQTGRAVLYVFSEGSEIRIGQWNSKPFQRTKAIRFSHSKTNWGCIRLDVWFRMNGQSWWGVNIGDNDIVRCKRIKEAV